MSEKHHEDQATQQVREKVVEMFKAGLGWKISSLALPYLKEKKTKQK